MNWIKRLFQKSEPEGKIIWSGTISSDGPEQQGPITVLACRTDFQKSEFKEGCSNAVIDFNAFIPMEKNLNYPENAYARGYIETYKGLASQRTDEVYYFISSNQDDEVIGKKLEDRFFLKNGVGKAIIEAWAAGEKYRIQNIFMRNDSYVKKATNE
jgi:hypothetical protein